MPNLLEYLAVLLAITAGAGYFNHYVFRLPRNIGVLVIALVVSLALRLLEAWFPQIGFASLVNGELTRTQPASLLLNGFLGFLLFAGALNVDVKGLLARRWTILALATVGVVLSTLLIAGGMALIFHLCGVDMPFAYCLVFGALISPTDPVTILDVLGRLGVPRSLQSVIAGESLFNDGIGIVLYAVFLQVALAGGDLSLPGAALDFLREAGGGALLGLVMGGIAFLAMRGIDEYNIELMISLALVAGTYGLAQTIGVSGPVAEVVAGLLMGSIGVKYAVSGTTHDYLHKFWLLTDEVLNSLLFLLIGLEFAAIDLRWNYLAAAALAVPLSLLARGVSIAAASYPLNVGAAHKGRAVALLTWSGLRGGISVALALSLPAGGYRDPLVTACYGLAVFTMVVQGLTLGPIAAWLYPESRPEPATPAAPERRAAER